MSFNETNGALPDSLIMDSAGNLLGTTYIGGLGYDGTAFELTPPPTETTSVIASDISPAPGELVTFTATVMPTVGNGATGTVQFQIDGADVGNPVAVIGNAATYTTSTLALGSHSVVAVYGGDNNYLTSTSSPLIQGIGGIGTSIDLVGSNSSLVYNQTVTFTATVIPAAGGSDTGTVQFQIDGVNVGAPVVLHDNTATYTTSALTVGSHSIEAIYSGDATFAGSFSTPFTQTVAPVASTTILVISSNISPTYGQSVTFVATVSPSYGHGETGTVQFCIDGVDVGSPIALSGNTASYTTSLLSAGSHSIVATYSGDASFITSTSPAVIQIIAKVSPWNLTSEVSFGVSALDGINPANMIADANGNFFGTTIYGGVYGDGSVFEIARGSEAFTTLVSFNGTNGQRPYDVSGLAIDSSGDLFGTTMAGGSSNAGTVFEVAQGSSAITVLASFNSSYAGNYGDYGGVAINSSDDLFWRNMGQGVWNDL